MNSTRRRFVVGTAVGIADVVAGCINAGQSGSESPTRDTTNNESQPVSKTVPHTVSSPSVSGTTDSIQSSSDCRMTPTQKGTAIIEASPPDITIINVTDERQTIRITVTPLPEDMTARPSENAPHEPRNLSAQPVFSRTIELPAGGGRVFRCMSIGDLPRKEFQVKIEVRDGSVGVFDWSRNTAWLDVAINASSIEFSAPQGR